jgi:hypothetical protein
MNQQIITFSAVPPLLPKMTDDGRRFLKAMKRKELRAAFSEHFGNVRMRMLVAGGLEQIRNEGIYLH